MFGVKDIKTDDVVEAPTLVEAVRYGEQYLSCYQVLENGKQIPFEDARLQDAIQASRGMHG